MENNTIKLLERLKVSFEVIKEAVSIIEKQRDLAIKENLRLKKIILGLTNNEFHFVDRSEKLKVVLQSSNEEIVFDLNEFWEFIDSKQK